MVRFDPSVGAEIQKTRPAVVVNANTIGRLPLRIVVPLPDWRPVYAGLPWIIRVPATAVNGLNKHSGADTFQVKSVAADRFVTKLGELTEAELGRVVAGIRLCIGAE